MTRPRAALYARYSTDKQNPKSIDDQIALGRETCARAGFDVVATFDDRAVSGATTANRPGWLALMQQAAARGFDVVVIEDIDRAFRDEADYHVARNRLAFLDIAFHTARGAVSRIEGSLRAMQGAMFLEDLARKVHRGQTGAVRRGRHVGPPSFGYRLLPPAAPGEPGRLVIDDAAAAVVRRVFADYLAGRSPRDIAAALNRDGVPGPRGGVWNASAIGGSRKRANGLLQNALYRGEIVWNRQRFVKDPDTGRRISRPNPEAEWIRSAAPDLAVVGADLFAAVQARRLARTHDGPAFRARHLLSGLVKCACCGGSYIVSGADKRGKILRCSRRLETGLCDNARTVALRWLESKVIGALESHLAAPDVVKAYVDEYHRLARAHAADAAGRRARLERRRNIVKTDARAVADAMVKQGWSRSLGDRLTALEAEWADLDAQIDAAGDAPVELHPRAGEIYRRQVADLKRLLDRDQVGPDALAALRQMVEKVVVIPAGPYQPVTLELHGRLAALLHLSSGTPVRSMGAMVAGDRNSRSHRLPALVVRI